MAIRHYYIEDIKVNPQREDRITPIQSIQFDLLSDGNIFVNIDLPCGKKITKASVIIPLDEIKRAYDWLLLGN
jgi:hypothetical protein